MVNGAANFFRLRQPLAGLQPTGALEATNFYETSELKSTLEGWSTSIGSMKGLRGSASAPSTYGAAPSSISTRLRTAFGPGT
jgi:hypothetical protein